MAGDKYTATVANVMTEPDKPATVETHTISVFLDRPTQATNSLAAVEQPSTSDSGNPFLPTNPSRQSPIQVPTLTPGETFTYSGMLISLASDGGHLITGTRTQAVALPPSVTPPAGSPVANQQVKAKPADGLTSQRTSSLDVKPGVSLVVTWRSSPVAASEAPVTAGVSNTVIAQPFRTLQSSGIPSEGQSAVAEQSFTRNHPLAASGNVSVSGTAVSLGPGLPSIVMGTNVQATGSHGNGSPRYELSNGTSPLAFQGYAARAHVMWGGSVTIAFSALLSMFFV